MMYLMHLSTRFSNFLAMYGEASSCCGWFDGVVLCMSVTMVMFSDAATVLQCPFPFAP
jgi:hypothetical protein